MNATTIYGGVVLITNGLYYPVNEIAVSNAVSIQSVNGPDVTIIDGGGAHRCFNLGSSASTVVGLTITNGYISAGNGGGVYCANKSPTVSRCMLSGNITTENGGGIYYGVVDNTILVGNSARSGGGFVKTTAYNCTVISNSATENGGGIYAGNVNNSIVWYNHAGNSGNNLHSSTVKASCSPDVTHGIAGNITNAPLFVAMTNGNYHLVTNSPCIDAGENSLIDGALDIDGIPRPLDADNDGITLVDMGCYEIMNIDSDSDKDNMPDGWELDNGLDPATADAEQDKDNDWYNNYSEYIAGTDPDDASSVFDLSYIMSTNGFVINWNSVTSRTYSVLWTDDLLTNSFHILETNIVYPGGSYTDTVHGTESEGFYKVDVQFNR